MDTVNGGEEVVLVTLNQTFWSHPAQVKTKDRTTDTIPIDLKEGTVGVLCGPASKPGHVEVAFEHGKHTAMAVVPEGCYQLV